MHLCSDIQTQSRIVKEQKGYFLQKHCNSYTRPKAPVRTRTYTSTIKDVAQGPQHHKAVATNKRSEIQANRTKNNWKKMCNKRKIVFNLHKKPPQHSTSQEDLNAV